MPRILLLLLLLVAALAVHPVRAQDQAAAPKSIRIGSGSTSGLGLQPQTGAAMGILQNTGLLEEEFKKDGIKIEWSFFKGLGPAQNEAFANNSLDFGYQGDLSAIIGKANGLKVKVLAATCVRQNNYVGVRADSPIASIRDIKGAKVAVQIGGPTYLFFNRLLEANGLTIKDVEVHNLVGAPAIAALLSKQVDVAFGIGLLELAQQGSVKIIYSTRDAPDSLKNVGVLVAREEFVQQYPAVTQRVVTQWVKGSAWGSRDENRAKLFDIWSRGGTTPVSSWETEYAGRSGKWITTPLLDEFVYEHTRQNVALCQQLGVIRSAFDVDAWIDPRFEQAALKELGLENYWPSYDHDGKEIKP